MDELQIAMPAGANTIIHTLHQNGFDAYIVGGCVRDSLLGLQPHDWDICTNARPEDIMRCFDRQRIIETGLQHGTVTIVLEDGSYEVTTYRIDGEYSDGRHPDDVTFTNDLYADLARRDFTINAMAYGSDGLIDPFGGANDLQVKLIRCVGNPIDRFTEDALRVMRAIRFSSTYGFLIDEETAAAIHQCKDKLKNIAAERIQTELCKTLLGDNVLVALFNFNDVFATIIPDLARCIDFEQNNPYHIYTVYDHIAHAVSYAPKDLTIRLALLLHDIGKPLCYTEDEKGGHFYGHAVESQAIASNVMDALRFDNETSRAVVELVAQHDSLIEPTPKSVKRWLHKIGPDRLRQLLQVHRADAMAHTPGMQQDRIDKCVAVEAVLDDVLAKEECFSLKDLAVTGEDAMALGVPEGKAVGSMLRFALALVINDEAPNDRDILLKHLSAVVHKFKT